MSSHSQPSWEALMIVATYLDPKTLAIASCVSKSWFSSMSSDHIWKPILATNFPSLSTLPSSSAVAYARLFSIGHIASTRRRRMPSTPRLSLHDLVFTVSISTRACDAVSTVLPGDALRVDMPGVFRFGVGRCDGVVLKEGVEEVRVTWNVVLRGWNGVFTMMERMGKVGFLPGGEGWFSQELPAPGCCSGTVASVVVADMRVRMCEVKGGEDDGVRVDEVSVGILSVLDWRYVSVEDGLRYLQHFLLPNHVT